MVSQDQEYKKLDYRNRKVLITGGMGFIGSNLATHLVELDAQVTLVDALIPGYGGNRFNISQIQDRVSTHISDIRDSNAVSGLIEGQDYLFNLAAQVSHVGSMTDPYLDLDINTKGQIVLLEACRRYNPKIRMIHASSRHVYGKPKQLPVDEESAISAVDVYSINKFAGESYHRLYHEIYGLSISILRLGNIYGPRQNHLDCVGVFMRRAAMGQPLVIFGGGAQIRDYIYVDDLCEAFLLTGQLPQTIGQVYNLGSPYRCSIGQFAGYLSKIANVSIQIQSFPPERKMIEVGDFYSSHTKFSNATGWHPGTSLEEGVRRTYEFFLRNKEQYC